MTGVWVRFDDGLLEAYGIVLEYLFRHALSWAYEPDNPQQRPDLERVLADNKYIDAESFMGYFHLWRYVLTRLPLPIPQLERIIPYVISRWNSVKGGSDAITKLLWLNMYTPPCSTPQSHAISRMILLGLVVIHRLNHFFTSKGDLKQSYQSLSHFRKAASVRSSFHDTLLQIVLSIKQRASLPPLSALPLFGSVADGVRTRKKDTRTNEVAWGAIREGITPKKSINKWYKKAPKIPAEVAVHNRMRLYTGVPLSRVSTVTKSRKDAWSRGSCAECGMLTNNFCIVCKKWLCDQQLPANRAMNNNSDDPKYVKISLDDGVISGTTKTICGIFSCWHKAHQAALEADGAFKRGWRCNESYGDDISSMSSP